MNGRIKQRLNNLPYHYARRIVVAIVGGCMVLVGVAMIVLPGPAFILIPAGLGVLALEFAWARHGLKKIKATSQHLISKVKDGSDSKAKEHQ